MRIRSGCRLEMRLCEFVRGFAGNIQIVNVGGCYLIIEYLRDVWLLGWYFAIAGSGVVVVCVECKF